MNERYYMIILFCLHVKWTIIPIQLFVIYGRTLFYVVLHITRLNIWLFFHLLCNGFAINLISLILGGFIRAACSLRVTESMIGNSQIRMSCRESTSSYFAAQSGHM